MKAGNLKAKWQKIKLKTIRRIDKWCEKYREKRSGKALFAGDEGGFGVATEKDAGVGFNEEGKGDDWDGDELARAENP